MYVYHVRFDMNQFLYLSHPYTRLFCEIYSGFNWGKIRKQTLMHVLNYLIRAFSQIKMFTEKREPNSIIWLLLGYMSDVE